MSFRLARMAAAAVLASALTAASASAATPSAYVYATSWSQTVRQYAADDAGAALAPHARPRSGTGADLDRGAPRRPIGAASTSSTRPRPASRSSTSAVDGTLTPKTPDSVATGTTPVAIAVAPDGRHVYVVNQGDSTVSTYDVDAAGALTLASSAATGAGAVQVAAQPRRLERLRHELHRRARSRSTTSPPTGALTPKQPATVAAGSRPAGIAVSADGASAYVTNQLRQRHHHAVLDRRRERRPHAQGAARWAPAASRAASWPPRGRVYVANVGSNTISQYAADGAGALSRARARGRRRRAARSGSRSRPTARASTSPASATPRRPVRRGRRRVAGRQGRPRAGQLPPPGRGGRQAARRAGADHRSAHAGRGRPVRAGRRGRGRLHVRRRGPLGPCVVHGRRARRRPAGHLDAGAHRFTVVARDGEGNETTVTHGYTVAEPPPRRRPRLIRASASRASSGRSTTAASSAPATRSRSSSRSAATTDSTSWPTARPAACRSTATTPARRPAASRPAASRGRGLRFNRWTGHYVFKWQTRTGVGGDLPHLRARPRDGSVAAPDGQLPLEPGAGTGTGDAARRAPLAPPDGAGARARPGA